MMSVTCTRCFQIYEGDMCPHCHPTPKDIRQQAHYTRFKIQPVVFISENNLDFLTGNIIKYILRAPHKNGIEDLKKAQHYLEMLIQKAEGKKVVP